MTLAYALLWMSVGGAIVSFIAYVLTGFQNLADQLMRQEVRSTLCWHLSTLDRLDGLRCPECDPEGENHNDYLERSHA